MSTSPSPASVLREQLARNLRAARQHAGLTQEQLAERSGLHQTYLSDIERGKRNVTLDVVERLAAALSVAPLALLAD
ncbi:helix-turn-helix domain-containing protein [Flagellatimonas centrodinii]|uniref:helix-turn-helix domain-containing protein n=1 Tax=Flagellatimonas centrodinii TaxID=2806210 RepID=UPI001FEF22F3|nr:helix-turn-helix transcriptional regulator [Flagellatimonas centrodinii]ULQ47565.1 helix-turn-helix domain-containing protein [Flagellatimonas centrodinii]